MELPSLAPLPGRIVEGSGRLVTGLYAGALRCDPVADVTGRGRVRRWRYVAAGCGDALVGAAVVDLGFVGVAFAFAAAGGHVVTWQTRRPLGRGVAVGDVPAAGAVCRTRSALVTVDGDGGFQLDVPVVGGRLRAEVTVTEPVEPATLLTDTAEGGWNATVKAAGSAAAGWVRPGGAPPVELQDAGAWSDWTVGRQDRVTTWRWGAGAGRADDGRRVGVNVSTGMNEVGDGEDLVWWEGRPHRLHLDRLGPTQEDAAGRWELGACGQRLLLEPAGVRRAHERLPLVTSSYVQPFGTWTGTLPDPSGTGRPVTLAGVAEDHLAVW